MPSATGTPADPGPSAYPATKAGAAAIARAYYSAILQGVHDNDAGPLVALAEPQCPCVAQLTNYIKSALTKGQHAVGGTFSMLSIGAFHSLSVSRATQVVEIVEAPGKVVAASGAVVSSNSGRPPSQELLVLVAHSGTWRLEQAERLS